MTARRISSAALSFSGKPGFFGLVICRLLFGYCCLVPYRGPLYFFEWRSLTLRVSVHGEKPRPVVGAK
jgi:hypothetical protein